MMAHAESNKTKFAVDLLNFGGCRRMPIVLQTEVAECGLACLAMVAGYYGLATDMTRLRLTFSVSGHGTGLKHLINIASRMNFSPRALRCEIADLSYVKLPCIAHWGLNHFVVLKGIKSNRYTICDPAIGERILSPELFSQEFTGVVLELTKTAEFKKADERKPLTLSHFWSSITGLKRSLVHVVLLALLLQIFTLVTPFYLQTIVDDVLPRRDFNLLAVLAIGFGLLMLIQVGTTALREFVILQISNRLAMQMSANLFRHLIRLPMDYFSKRHIGDIVSRFGSLTKVRELLTHGIVTAVVDGSLAAITLVAMFFYDIKLTLIVIGAVAIYLLARWLIYHPVRRLNEESILASAKENSHFMESMRSIQTIKLFQRENDRQNQWQNRLVEVLNKNIRISRWGIGATALNGLLFGLENIFVTYFAAESVMSNLISLGMLYSFMTYKNNFVSALDSLIAKWIEFKMLGLHLNRLADITFTQPEDIDIHSSAEFLAMQDLSAPCEIHGKIEVRNLSYRYGDNDPYIFKDLNFVINPGETVAITGPSGCGKTTLLKCLMGLIPPTEGDIFIDDKPIKKVPQYRSKIASIMQEDQLLSGDISENISCFSPQINAEKVLECATLASIHLEISAFPMGYNTLVGDMGSSLSGGQKQRLLLARALYREPRILFMDEATSHLDLANEVRVNNNIQQLAITRVIIAHRPETIRTAGRQISLA